jgi:two-component sensor histidine kinase
MCSSYRDGSGVEPPVPGRRRRILRLLRSRGKALTVAELATRLATEGASPPESEDGASERVRVDLVHVHLPKLTDAGLVEWDRERRVVRATEPRGRENDSAVEDRRIDADRDRVREGRLEEWLCCPNCGCRDVICGGVGTDVELECPDCERDGAFPLERRSEGRSRDSGSGSAGRSDRERALEASNERLEQFAYAASHDLQEPLRMVSSYLRLIDQRYGDELDEDGEEFLRYAVDGAERMRAMIDGLLAYSRIETQGTAFEPVSLEEVLADVRKDLEVRIEETNADVTIEPLPRVDGDETQLRQLFQNLLSNALEYGGDERPVVRVEAERRGSEWHVSVRDEGIGIEPGNQKRIFDVFERLHGYHERRGTGIGLAICERIVERHGGEIRVESIPNEGSTFVLTLPAIAGRP